MKEIWKDIEGYEGYYQVSNLGNVRRLNKDYRSAKYKYLKPKIEKNGYLRVCLYKKTIHKFYSIHRLVALTFIPNPDNKPTVNHINGKKDDNRIENLEWATYSENELHSIYVLKNNKNTQNQRQSASIIGKSTRKLTMLQALEIKKEYKKISRKELSKKYKVSVSTINKIIQNKTYIL